MGDVGGELIGRLKELSGGVDACIDDNAVGRHLKRIGENAHKMAYGAARYLRKLFVFNELNEQIIQRLRMQ